MRHLVMVVRDLRFYFDYLSPYSYLAWQKLPALIERHRLVLEPTPVLLAGLLDHYGHKGPGEIPPKHAYSFKDCLRRAARLGVPFNPPFSHPFRPLLALRVTLLDMDADLRVALVSRLFAATWSEGQEVSDEKVVGVICAEVGVQDALKRVEVPDAKTRLRNTTAEAIGRGVFGVPTMLVGDELFWGTDSFQDIEAYLEGRDPVASADREAWDAVRPSAVRPSSK